MVYWMVEKRNDNEGFKKENANLREALKQVLYQNEMLLGWVDGAVVTVTREGHILSANEKALDSLGWSIEELEGRQCHETFHHTLDDGGEYPWDFSPIFAAIEDGSSHNVTGDTFWKSNGMSFAVDYIVCPIRDDNNLISGATLIFRNLTEQRLKEVKHIHSMKLESIGELSAGIAHEINTPMQFIGNNISFLKESFDNLLELVQYYQKLKRDLPDNEQLRDLITNINRKEEEADIEFLMEDAPAAFDQTNQGVDRVTQLVLGLKGFSHSAESETKTETDINEIIQNTLIVCNNAYKYVAVLTTNFGVLPLVKVYRGDIGQVVLNLIVNAAQAIEDARNNAEEMGEITVTTNHEGEKIIITVSDSGSGIKESVRERIFDPFFTTKEVGRGSGQGLAISHTIIYDKHGGEMNVESALGEGSVFTVTLPVDG